MSDRDVPPTDTRPDPLDPFDEQWLKVEPAVLRLLQARLKSVHDARDATHEIYIQLRECSSAATILHLKSYALTAAKNAAVEWHREDLRRMLLNKRFLDLQSASQGDADEHTPERIYDGQQRLKQALQALEQLPEQSRLICQARADGEATKSIAKRLRLELRTVYRRLRSTRQWLSEVLGLARDREP